MREDIPNAPEWIDALINPLNTFMEEVYFALDRDLELETNVKGAIRTITFTTRSDYSTANPATNGWIIQKINDPIGRKPECVAIGQVTDKDSFSVVTDPVSCNWDYLNGVVRINYIAGLADSTKYEIKLLIF